jgi:hypothetical protein
VGLDKQREINNNMKKILNNNKKKDKPMVKNLKIEKLS